MLKLRAKNYSTLWLEKMKEQMNNHLHVWLSNYFLVPLLATATL
jgi:hypothetical protein